MGFTGMKSAQTPSLTLALYYDDDDNDDCDVYKGHLQKNLPKYVRNEVPVGRMSIRCDPPESPKWVSHA